MKRLLTVALTVIVALTMTLGTSVCAYGASSKDALELEATTAILIDAKTGEILFSKNKDVQMAPASMTKIMTALLAIENLDMDTVVTIDDETPYTEGNIIYMHPGEKFKVEQLLKAMLVSSANDCAVALAKTMSGTVKDFANLMNGKAKELGAKNTNFVNPNGLDDKRHVSTAYDFAMIAKEAMKNETFREIVSMTSYTVPKTNKNKKRPLYTTNRLLSDKYNDIVVNGEYRKPYYKDAIGIKTGFTPVALGSLCAAAERNGTELISVVMHSSDFGRFADTIALFEYGFANYSTYTVYDKGEAVETIKVKGGKPDEVKTVTDYYAAVNLKKSESKDIVTKDIVWNDKIVAPIAKGTVVGQVKLYKNKKLVTTTNIVTADKVEEGMFSFLYNGHVAYPGKLALLIAAIVLVLLAIVLVIIRIVNRRKRMKQRQRQAMKIARERKYGHR